MLQKEKTKVKVQILSLLNQFTPAERIEIIESIGKRLRQANSIETAKEVERFSIQSGGKKDIDYTPVKNRYAD